MTKYNAMVFPRGFSVTVEADNPDDAYDIIDGYVRDCCTVTLARYDNSYEPENLLDDFDIDDITEAE